MQKLVVVPMWAAVLSFDEWKAQAGPEVCAKHDESMLWHWHGGCVDPAHLIDIPPMDTGFTLRIVSRDQWPNQRRIVVIDAVRAQQRIALATWKECNRLLSRHLTLDAKRIVHEIADKMAIVAGITIEGVDT